MTVMAVIVVESLEWAAKDGMTHAWRVVGWHQVVEMGAMGPFKNVEGGNTGVGTYLNP